MTAMMAVIVTMLVAIVVIVIMMMMSITMVGSDDVDIGDHGGSVGDAVT